MKIDFNKICEMKNDHQRNVLTKANIFFKKKRFFAEIFNEILFQIKLFIKIKSKDCFQNKSKFITEDQIVKHMNITIC